MKSVLLNRVLPVLGLVIVSGVIALAQPGSGGPGPGQGPAAVIPIDGGVSLLLAGGVAYGLKHLRARRKKV